MRRTTLEGWRRASVTYNTKPVAPAQPTATNTTANGVHLATAAVPTADTYKYQQTLSGGTTWTDVYTGTDPFTDVTGLTAATAYDFRVAAFDGTAQSDWSPIRTVTTLGSAAPPATPTAPTSSNVTDTTATLAATPVSTATFYSWQRSATSGTTGFAAVTGTTTTLNDSGLTALTPYWYRVAAGNADGTSAFSTATAVTTTAAAATVPGKPTTPTFVSSTSTSITLAWTANPTSTSETIRYSLNNAAPWTIGFTGSALGATVTGLSPATSYYFQRASSNAVGTSVQSDSTAPLSTSGAVANVQPVSALSITSRAGADTHPNFNTSTNVYQVGNAEAIVSRLAGMGFTYMRGQLPVAAVADVWATACRNHNMKWLMGIVPEGGTTPTDQTVAQTRAEVARINANYADICYAIEGINEPNANRAGGTVPLDWAHTTFLHAQVIWQESRKVGSNISTVPVIGTSLHDVNADNSYTQAAPQGGKFHFEQLRDEGILTVQTHSGLHTYPGGSFPIRQLDSRLVHIYTAYGANYPVMCTEHGWHNALATTLGHKPISEAGAATYGPRGLLQFLSTVKPNGIVRDLCYGYYETMDDFDGTPPFANIESHFGLYRVSTSSATAAVNPSSWSAKPIVGTISALLNRIADPPGTAPYTPPQVVCAVSSGASGANLQWQVVATKAQANAGTATLCIYRDMDVWNRTTLTPITVPAVTATLTDRVGARTIQVDAEVQYVDLR